MTHNESRPNEGAAHETTAMKSASSVPHASTDVYVSEMRAGFVQRHTIKRGGKAQCLECPTHWEGPNAMASAANHTRLEQHTAYGEYTAAYTYQPGRAT